MSKMMGIKEKELVELGPCRVCGRPQLNRGGLPLFYRVTVTRAGFDSIAVSRRVGLGMLLTSQKLAWVMGPDEDLAKVIDGPHSLFVHEECADKVRHLLELFPEPKEDGA